MNCEKSGEMQYNGEKIQYRIIKSKIKNIYIHIKEGQVIVKAPVGLKEKYIQEIVNKKLKWIYKKIKEQQEIQKERTNDVIQTEDIQRLEKVVIRNVEKYSRILGVKPNKVRIRNIKYAWGSCSSNRNITINLKLAKKEEKAIEYVVLHEMCHLKYMNHSKEFWELVENNMKDYKKYRKILK